MSLAAPIFKVEGVSKRFCRDTARSLRYGILDLAQALSPFRRPPAQLRPAEFWSLDNVSFEIRPGEAVAIGGRNGAGKTTLLRILAGLLQPDRGRIQMQGTVNPVIELGQGLNPMLTGRENAEIGLAWRGLGRRDVSALLPTVEAFAELGAMFDTPVNSYSAGMRVRLAFAIATAIPCDLLLLDEVLAVGDLAFQHKCITHLQQHLARGGALILVSHNPVQMQALCRRGILLDQGKLVLDGSIEDCIDQMFAIQKVAKADMDTGHNGESIAKIDEVAITSLNGNQPIQSGDLVRFDIAFTLNLSADVLCTCSIWTHDLSVCISNLIEPSSSIRIAGRHNVHCQIPNFPLSHGTFAIRANIVDAHSLLALANIGYTSPAVEFKVSDMLSRESLLARNIGQLIQLENFWSNGLVDTDMSAHKPDSPSATPKILDDTLQQAVQKC